MSLESQIAEIHSELELLGKSNSKRARKRKSALSLREFVLLDSILRTEDEEYNTLAERNLDLLEGENLRFVVYEDGSGYFTSLTQKLEGSINSIGLLYLECARTNVDIFNFLFQTFAKSFSGTIDYFGRTSLEITKRGFHLFGSRIPEIFTGKITRRGTIEMNLEKSRYKFRGTTYTGSVVCEVFMQDENRRIEFMSNKEILFKKMRTLVSKIKHEQNPK